MGIEGRKRVSIIGCGWLGLPLASFLLSTKRYTVKGSTTSPQKLPGLLDAGIEACVASLTPAPSDSGTCWATLLETDCLVVDIPPRQSRNGGEFHPQQLKELAKLIHNSPVSEIIYTSSTSVYPDSNRQVEEEDVTSPDGSGAPFLVEAELVLTALRNARRKVTILRCGGLMGYDRIPGKYVKGKTDMTTGDIPVNYVHRDDVVAIIGQLIATSVPNETYNVVAPLHPVRRLVYLSSCAAFGWVPPTFSPPDPPETYKVVRSDKLQKALNYSFIYPDPLAFHYALPSA